MLLEGSDRRCWAMSVLVLVAASLDSPAISAGSRSGSVTQARSPWLPAAVSALEREDCRSALGLAKDQLSSDPRSAAANRIAAVAVDCENTLHARSYIRSRVHSGGYRPVDLQLWRQTLAASTQVDPDPAYRALARCKLDMLSRRPDTALADCGTSYRVGRRSRFAFQATFSLGQALLDDKSLGEAEQRFQEAAGIARSAGNQRDRQSAEEHAHLARSMLSNIPTPMETEQDAEAVQEEMIRDIVMRQNEEAWGRR